MVTIIHLVAEYALWFYLTCIVGALIFLLLFLRARRSQKEALFGLEHELATRRQQRFGISIMLTLLIAVLIITIQTVIAPDLPAAHSVAATATPDIFRTPPPTFTNITPSPTATMTPTVTLPTVTPAFLTTSSTVDTTSEEETTSAEESLTETPLEETPQPTEAICAIIEPADGSTVEGEITFLGSAYADNFMFYKLEAYGPETNGVWASIVGDVTNQPVVDGVLGSANLTGWAAGGYSIRVIIVDNTSNEVASCFTSITIAGQQ